MPNVVLLPRGVIAVAGDDRVAFLQGIITQDIHAAREEAVVYSALLTPQGKFLFDFMIHTETDRFLLECAADRTAALLARLRLYVLRSQVTLADVSADYQAVALLEGVDGMPRDPRDAGMGGRALLPAAKLPAFLHRFELRLGELEAYEARRIARVIPEAGVDLIPEQTLLLEAHFEALHGVDFTKGCYVGQEVTARSKHRANLRKQLYGVTIEGEIGEVRTIVQGDKEVGDLRSHLGSQAIAMLRIEAVESGEVLRCGGVVLRAFVPSYQ